MRIAIFCHKFWPAVGGLCTYTGRLTEYLTARDHEVQVFTTKSSNTADQEHVTSNLLVHRFDTVLASHPPYYFMPRLLARVPAFRGVDVVHSVGYYFFGTVFANAMAKA